MVAAALVAAAFFGAAFFAAAAFFGAAVFIAVAGAAFALALGAGLAAAFLGALEVFFTAMIFGPFAKKETNAERPADAKRDDPLPACHPGTSDTIANSLLRERDEIARKSRKFSKRFKTRLQRDPRPQCRAPICFVYGSMRSGSIRDIATLRL